MNKLSSLINCFYRHPVFAGIFHTTVYCLQRELRDCKSVLDIGCGPSSPLQHCPNIKYSVGVEPFKLYLNKSKKKKIHTKYLNKKIEELNFPEKSFDAVIMIEVLEHLPKKLGYEISKKAEKWAKKKVIVTTPNGFWPQRELDRNVLQKHLSGWVVNDFLKVGYNVFGLSGLKFLRKQSESNSMDGNLLSQVRFKPKSFWFVVLALSELVVYFFPDLSFELFCIKKLKD